MSFKFFEETDDTKEYKYKILVYPNITLSSNLKADSYIIVIENVIRSLRKIRDDIHWTLILPDNSPVNLRAFENVRILEYEVPTYPNTMRTHFDALKFDKIIKWRWNDYDVVYCHLPEQALAIKNYFENATNLSMPIIGYCHWYETEENTGYSETMLTQNLIGTLSMKECGVNSKWLKNLVLDKAKTQLSSENIDKLDKIIQPHYLGINDVRTEAPKDIIPKSIIFNHRSSEYTGYSWFIERMDELWIKRQDFKVFTTIADESISRPYLESKRFPDREEYLEFLAGMTIGVACFQRYSAWSISVTDGLGQRVPYLVPADLCYPEMMQSGYPLHYSNKEEFLLKLEATLDGPYQRYSKEMAERLLWDDRVPTWFNNWNIFNDLPILKEKTDGYMEIFNFIKSKKGQVVSKHEIMEVLNWGMRIKFSPYRNLLRQEPGIKFLKDGYLYQ